MTDVGLVVGIGIIVVGLLLLAYVIIADVLDGSGPIATARRIRAEELQAEARIQAVTYAAMQRMYDTARRATES